MSIWQRIAFHLVSASTSFIVLIAVMTERLPPEDWRFWPIGALVWVLAFVSVRKG